MATKADHQIYADCMAPLKLGVPLWDPAPHFDSVRIADVGYFYLGGFQRLFNASDAVDAETAYGVDVPEGHVPLVVGPIINTISREPGPLSRTYSEASSVRGEIAGNADLAKGKASFSCEASTSAGALLLTKYKTKRYDAQRRGLFEAYILKHYQAWFRFAKQYGHPVKSVDQLLLVTGCDMTADFSMFAFAQNNRSINIEFEVAASHGASANALWGHWKCHSPRVHKHCGPERAAEKQLPEPEGEPPLDQCVFVRGLRVFKRTLPMAPVKLQAAAEPQDPDSPDSDGSSDGQTTWTTLTGDTDDDADIIQSTCPPAFEDPMAPLARRVFENSSADLVVVHDNDWDTPFSLEQEGDDIVASFLQTSNESCHDDDPAPEPSESNCRSEGGEEGQNYTSSIRPGSSINGPARALRPSLLAAAPSLRYDARDRKLWHLAGGADDLFKPAALEAVLLEGPQQYRPAEQPILAQVLGQYPARNKFISDYIFQKAGISRTPKQVGSDLQHTQRATKRHRGVPELLRQDYFDTATEALDDSANAQPATSKWITFSLFALCIFMHVILVGFHVVLVVFRYRLAGTAFKFPISSVVTSNCITATLFEKVSLLPNVVIKLYFVPLLYLTQRLALRRGLHLSQTVTAMHDKAQSWLSLDAFRVTLVKHRAILRKWRQDPVLLCKDLYSFCELIFVFMYLAGGLLLAILAPDLITAGPVIGNTDSFQKLTSALSDIGGSVHLIQAAFPVVELLPLLSTEQDIIISGLSNNLIYDIPTFIIGAPVPVNVTGFNVQCQSISGASQSGVLNPINSTFPIHVHDDLMDIDVVPLPRTINIRPAIWRTTSLGPAPPPVLLLASMIPVTDKTGSSGSTIMVNEALDPKTCVSAEDCNPTTSVRFMACSVGVQNHILAVQVLTESFPYIQAEPIDITTNYASTWSDWTGPGAPTDSILTNIGSFATISPSSHAVQLCQVPGSNRMTNYTLSVFEDNVIDALRLYNDSTARPDLVAKAITAGFWRGVVYLIVFVITDDEKVQYSLQIRHWQPWLGTAISGMMFSIALVLTFPAFPTGERRHQPHVTGLGVLELTWLLGYDQNRVARQNGCASRPALSPQDVKTPATPASPRLETRADDCTTDGDGGEADRG